MSTAKDFDRLLIELRLGLDLATTAPAALHALSRRWHRLRILERQIGRGGLNLAAAIQAIDPQTLALSSKVADRDGAAVGHQATPLLVSLLVSLSSDDGG